VGFVVLLQPLPQLFPLSRSMKIAMVLVVAAVAIPLWLLENRDDGRSDDLRIEPTRMQILATYSGADPFAVLVAGSDPDRSARVRDARTRCGQIVADIVVVGIDDPGGPGPAALTLTGTTAAGEPATCTIEAFWTPWCKSRYRGCDAWDGAWVRSPSHFWTERDLRDLRSWRESVWPTRPR